MKISDIYDFEDTIYVNTSLDANKELRIERDINQVDESSLFFLYPKAGSQKSPPIPDFPNKKPYAIVCDWETDEKSVIPLVKVKNTRRTLAHYYSKENNIDYSALKIIGITGTNGKSSTAEILFKILRESGHTAGFIGTGIIKINERVINEEFYSMTTPDPEILYPTIKRMQNEGCTYIVMEVSSHALSLSKVAPIKFKSCIFTNLSKEHSDFHKDMEEYYSAKLSLFRQTEIGVFNLDDAYSGRAYNEAECIKYSVGVIRQADANILDYNSNGILGSSYFYKEKGLIFKTELHLAGAHNVYNALVATKCALALGIPAKDIKQALGSIKAILGRYEVIDGEIKVVIDYAHTPKAMENILKSLSSDKILGQKLILVFGCGGNRDSSKRPVMGKCAEKFADFIILTEDNSRNENTASIIGDIEEGISKKDAYTVIEDREDAIRHAIISAEKDDIVAIIGKGHERYIINKDGYRTFDERSIIKKALDERRRRNENKA